jgi:hypothetical protein
VKKYRKASNNSAKIIKQHKAGVIIMQAILWTVEEVAQRAKHFYENGIRQPVECNDNIGKMIVIDAEIGEYGTDKTGVETAFKLKQKKPNTRLFYDADWL